MRTKHQNLTCSIWFIKKISKTHTGNFFGVSPQWYTSFESFTSCTRTCWIGVKRIKNNLFFNKHLRKEELRHIYHFSNCNVIQFAVRNLSSISSVLLKKGRLFPLKPNLKEKKCFPYKSSKRPFCDLILQTKLQDTSLFSLNMLC